MANNMVRVCPHPAGAREGVEPIMESTTPMPASLLPRDFPERRAWPRRAQHMRVLVMPEDCALEEPYGAWLIDSSRGGVRLVIAHEAIAAGTLLRIRAVAARAAVRWLTVRVKRCRQCAMDWELGRELVPAPRPHFQRAG
jgi:hypothetical protein